MPKIGFARVSSTGQRLDMQIDKLNQVGCDKTYHEKQSAKTAARPKFQKCMNYLREGDTLVITRLDRLARSVIHLSQVAERFQEESIDLVVIDQAIDTSTATGR
ncbi:MAG: recombinase family protein [Paraglaciecola sp.]|nr:recombinase family protein [Paraglaciecola sp.]